MDAVLNELGNYKKVFDRNNKWTAQVNYECNNYNSNFVLK